MDKCMGRLWERQLDRLATAGRLFRTLATNLVAVLLWLCPERERCRSGGASPLSVVTTFSLSCWVIVFSSLSAFFHPLLCGQLTSLSFNPPRRVHPTGRRLFCWSRHSNPFITLLLKPSRRLSFPMRRRLHAFVFVIAFALTLLNQASALPTPKVQTIQTGQGYVLQFSSRTL